MYISKASNDGYFYVDGMIQDHHIYKDIWAVEHEKIGLSYRGWKYPQSFVVAMPFSIGYLPPKPLLLPNTY